MNELDEFNPRQEALLKEFMERRAASVKKAESSFPAPKRPVVTPDEYNRRLQAQIQTDNALAKDLKQERVDAALKVWDERVGPRFAYARVDSPEIQKRVNERVARIVNNGPLHKNSMVLTGHLGVGKTWTGFAYARQLIEEGVLRPAEVLFGTEIGLLTPLALASFDRTEKIQEFLNLHHKFFFIDEVGRATFKSPELRHEIWYAIINHAYENHIPVVITTNKSSKPSGVKDTMSNKAYKSEMEMWIGEAAYDRLKYMVGEDGAIVPGDENKRAEVNSRLDNHFNDGRPRITLSLSTKNSTSSTADESTEPVEDSGIVAAEKPKRKSPVKKAAVKKEPVPVVEHEFPVASPKISPAKSRVRKSPAGNGGVGDLRPPLDKGQK